MGGFFPLDNEIQCARFVLEAIGNGFSKELGEI
jgi:hypothetical protein